jgi:hypothetical protein
MSDPETEDFGKEIIPQVVVIKYFKYSIWRDDVHW